MSRVDEATISMHIFVKLHKSAHVHTCIPIHPHSHARAPLSPMFHKLTAPLKWPVTSNSWWLSTGVMQLIEFLLSSPVWIVCTTWPGVGTRRTSMFLDLLTVTSRSPTTMAISSRNMICIQLLRWLAMCTFEWSAHPIAAAYVEHVHFWGPVDADDNVFVGRCAQAHVIHPCSVSIDHALTLGGVCAPNAHCRITAAADNCRAVECHTAHNVRVFFEYMRALARPQVPYAQCIVSTSRDESVLLSDPMKY